MSETSHILDIRIFEGRDFPLELHRASLQLTGTFNGQRRTSQATGEGSTPLKEFNTILRWRLTAEDFRQLNQTGLHTCKLMLHKEGEAPQSAQEALGWIAVDLKKAKANAQQFGPDPPPGVEGDWLAVRGSARKPESQPEIKMLPLFYDQAAALRASAMKRDLLQVLQQEAQAVMAAAAAPRAKPTAAAPSTAPSTRASIELQQQQQRGKGEEGGEGDASLPTFVDLSPAAQGLGDELESPGGGLADIFPQGARASVSTVVHRGGDEGPDTPPLLSGAATPEGRPSIEGAASSTAFRKALDPPSVRPSASASLPNPSPLRRSLTDLVKALDRDAVAAPRRFRLTVDVRSFKSGKRLPLNLASVFAAVQLPPELTPILAGGPVPSHSLPPLRTHPPVDIVRGCEGQLPNACTALEFTCDALELARCLVSSSPLLVEVWHRERLRSDLLLGVASVPLNGLLSDPWIDGWAAIYALLVQDPPPSPPLPEQRVQVGALRVVLALEDLGPFSGATLTAVGRESAGGASPSKQGKPGKVEVRKLSPAERERATAFARQEGDLAQRRQRTPPRGAPTAAAPPVELDRALQLGLPERDAAAAAGREADDSTTALQDGADAAASPAHAAQQVHTRTEANPSASAPPVPSTAVHQDPAALHAQQHFVRVQQTQAAVAAAAAQQYALPQQAVAPIAVPPPQIQGLPASLLMGPSKRELDAAVAAELERVRGGVEAEARERWAEWRAREEGAFRARCREVEAERLQVLEGEFRKRERAREAEVSGLRQEYGALEAKLREVLGAAEEREGRVLAAEEGLARKRKAMEHEHSLRLQEAEAAVRRLQAEFEHQLVLERERTAEAVRQRQEAERRLQDLQVRYEGLHQAFEAHRDKARSAPEGRAQAELALAVEARHRAEERAERLGRAKKQYKEQVLRLAREVALLQRQRLAEAEQWMARERRHVDALSLIQAAGQAAGAARQEKDELHELRQQLQKLAAAAAVHVSSDLPPSSRAGPAPLRSSVDLPQGSAGDPGLSVQSELSAELRRLLQERAELLETGVYSEGDPLIEELGRQIATVRAGLGMEGPGTTTVAA